MPNATLEMCSIERDGDDYDDDDDDDDDIGDEGGHLRAVRKVFFSIEEVEHNMVVDTTKQMAQVVHIREGNRRTGTKRNCWKLRETKRTE